MDPHRKPAKTKGRHQVALFQRRLNEKAAYDSLKQITRIDTTDHMAAQSSHATAIFSGLILEELRELNKKLDELLEKQARP